jgi:hypothetical protein
MQIEPISAFEFQLLVHDRDRFLAFDIQVSKLKFLMEALLIGGLQQARSENTVDFDRGSDNCVGYFIIGHRKRR